jgi:hypothetical protein
MPEHQVIEGTWEEIARYAGKYVASGKRMKLIVPLDEAQTDAHPLTPPVGHAYFGMFKDAVQTTEEDFKDAEFHGDPDDGLDWSR